MAFLDILLVLALTLGVVGTSALLGAALQLIAGLRAPNSVAPALGFGMLLTVGFVVARLPGAGLTIAISVAVLTLAAVGIIARDRARVSVAKSSWVLVSVTAVATLFPFVVNGRFGVLGPGFNDDFAPHLYWAEVLSSGRWLEGISDTNYPVGAHGVAASISAAIPPLRIEYAFIALILAVHPLLALLGASALRDAPSAIRWTGALLVGFPYLVVAYTVQGSFKEPMMGVLVVAMALTVRDAMEAANRRAWLLLLMPGLGMYAIYGKSAAPWPAGCWGA